jgi:hypothetical protein
MHVATYIFDGLTLRVAIKQDMHINNIFGQY